MKTRLPYATTLLNMGVRPPAAPPLSTLLTDFSCAAAGTAAAAAAPATAPTCKNRRRFVFFV
jgi:hypothetical protein